ncbi:MAG: TraB/GumN family protein [Lewinellaceae bacterium]|nr:TraB/GumN family protein [Saprospiraceae bacterium]MCB9343255.1 TraB/GumN family protein [Lewinellaceae bacterium]
MKNILLLLPLAWLTACHPARQAAVAYTPDQLVPTEKSVVWKISGNKLKKPSYLYGTIHMIPKSEFEMPGVIREALDRSKRVTFEIDMKEMTNFRTQFGLLTKAFMPGGKTLKDLLNEDDYQFVKSKISQNGFPSSMMERIKPLFLSTLFSGDESGIGGNMGSMTSVEMELFKSAKNRRLETAGLETASYQMSVFDSIPLDVQAKMLVDGLRSTDEDSTGGEGQLDELLQLYKDQDINAMQTMVADEGSGMADYEDVFLKRRNQNWIEPMSNMMREKPTIFAVGAGHLGGPDGVIALLRKEGFRVEVAQE